MNFIKAIQQERSYLPAACSLAGKYNSMGTGKTLVSSEKVDLMLEGALQMNERGNWNIPD